ncbi:MAG: ATP-grasp domain-containing protein [Myxococcales bacterium]|nr:ATP-grasp domain-containing protein [Myxococcales bacterium]
MNESTPALLLLFGGTSGERRVSVASAQNVSTLFSQAKTWFWTPDGRVVVCERAALLAHKKPFEEDFAPTDEGSLGTFASIEVALDHLRAREPDCVVLLCLHGGTGEDGTIQRLCEARDLAYTGSDSAASAKAFDKVLAKSIVRAAGGRVAESVVLPPDDVIAARAAIEEIVSEHGRAVVKPVADGSSVGLFHARTLEDARTIAEEVASRGVAYLCEAFVSGPELTVGVAQTDSGEARVLCASEVRLDPGRVFDFEGKYLGKGTIELTPAEQPAPIVRAAEDLALLAHNALGCEGYTRTDVIVSERGAVFLETNTLPGLTKASFIPQQVAAKGEELGDFLRTHIRLALARRDRDRAARTAR